jgi:trigger factor
MEVNQKNLNDTQVELEVKLDGKDIQPYLERTARDLSAARPIPGFRPGKASYEVARRHFGAELIFKESVDAIINGSLNRAIDEKKIRVFEEGEFKILENTPESIHFTISFTVLPQIQLNDWTGKKLERPEVKVTDDEIKEALLDLAKMLAKEQMVDRVAKESDKVVVDFEVFVDSKVIEGGIGKSHPVIIGEKKMIPGFEDQLVGKKANDEFSFTLKFPDNYAAGLSGKEGTFKIKVHSVMERVIPEITDETAKNMGEESRESLVKRLSENILNEKQMREQDRLEVEAIKMVVDSATIGTIPEKAVDMEADRFLKEFEHDLIHQGLSMEIYLKNAGKTLEDLKKEFRPKVVDRVRAALVISQIVDENNLTVEPDELEAEVNDQKEYFARKNPQAVKEVETTEYRRYLYNRLINRKAIRFVAEKLVK